RPPPGLGNAQLATPQLDRIPRPPGPSQGVGDRQGAYQIVFGGRSPGGGLAGHWRLPRGPRPLPFGTMTTSRPNQSIRFTSVGAGRDSGSDVMSWPTAGGVGVARERGEQVGAGGRLRGVAPRGILRVALVVAGQQGEHLGGQDGPRLLMLVVLGLTDPGPPVVRHRGQVFRLARAKRRHAGPVVFGVLSNRGEKFRPVGEADTVHV